MRHRLKTLSKYYRRVLDGSKLFEIRKNDRDFQTGDELELIEISEGNETGESVVVRVTYMTGFNQRLEYVVLGISPPFLDPPENFGADIFLKTKG